MTSEFTSEHYTAPMLQSQFKRYISPDETARSEISKAIRAIIKDKIGRDVEESDIISDLLDSKLDWITITEIALAIEDTDLPVEVEAGPDGGHFEGMETIGDLVSYVHAEVTEFHAKGRARQ